MDARNSTYIGLLYIINAESIDWAKKNQEILKDELQSSTKKREINKKEIRI